MPFKVYYPAMTYPIVALTSKKDYSLNESTFCCSAYGINATWNFTLIKENMNWSGAQNYCRHSNTDLATVRNKEDNDLIHKMVTSGTEAWIGLFQDTWEWSDQSNSSFRNFKIGQNGNMNNTCALAQVTWPETWDMTPCDEKHPFICYDGEL
uniref:C-type lectin domain-containing protein n=1 Tax=Paramormyrops kingsleyae TaxID=1676925 RepID=A0A3B3TA96_9TELE